MAYGRFASFCLPKHAPKAMQLDAPLMKREPTL